MSYIILTGASAGIGEHMAKQLAEQNNDLILVARRKEKLETLAYTLAGKYGIQVECLALDLSEPDSAEQLFNLIAQSGWSIKALINNAGIGDRGAFSALSLERQLQMIQLNVNTLVALTHRVIPLLSQSEAPYIINVASTAAFQAGPNMAVYYATKAFVLSFSEALHEELKPKGISVSALCPGPTDSEFASEANMTDTKLFKAGAMGADEVARQAIAKRNKAIVITGFKNKIGVWLGKLSPRAINRKLAGWLQA